MLPTAPLTLTSTFTNRSSHGSRSFCVVTDGHVVLHPCPGFGLSACHPPPGELDSSRKDWHDRPERCSSGTVGETAPYSSHWDTRAGVDRGVGHHFDALLPEESGALAGNVLLTTEPADMRLSLQEVAWEPMSAELHGQCDLRLVEVNASDDAVGFSFLVVSTYPDDIPYVTPVVVVSEADELLGGATIAYPTDGLRHVAPGASYGGILEVKTPWIDGDWDDMDAEMFCIENLPVRVMAIGSNAGRDHCGSGIPDSDVS